MCYANQSKIELGITSPNKSAKLATTPQLFWISIELY